VKVKRSGLRIRSRSGYYGITDEEKRPVRKTPDEQIAAAIMSPFSASDIRLKLTSQHNSTSLTNPKSSMNAFDDL
jgi:hypothetical protein